MPDVVRPIGQFFETMTGAPDAQRRIEALRAENGGSRHDLAAQRLDRKRSAELRSLLGVAGRGGYKIVPAQVIARRGTPGFEDAVEIDVGAADGVRPEMTVLNGDGLVGRVVQAGPSTSTVVLLSDPGLVGGCPAGGQQRDRGGERRGGERQRSLIRFRLLDSTAPLTAGTGSSASAPSRARRTWPGVPIGVIERVEATPGELTRIAYARPYADLTALDVVGVVVKAPDRDPRDSVLPPVPPVVKAHQRAESKDKSKDKNKNKNKDKDRGRGRDNGRGSDRAEPESTAESPAESTAESPAESTDPPAHRRSSGPRSDRGA